ncbi:DUF4381 domain-containing protein [Legionella impletisoli]|uniref:DUF4381 domain-containing protein n=1 Tax=Legionella impletisoli TaxID=343510 RepID=A0A917JU00_9GAMM|nr:DUF4381 domain-containing protein [Legionella impletisoli]GGI84741.1 hypothetical protein GCM10007966_11650 [Legionella impletisoli]
MANSVPQELAQLRDIHLPVPVGWWPLAPGWYMLFLVFVLGMACCIWILYRRYLHARSKRQALRLLNEYHVEYKTNHNSKQASARISELLKRVALVYFPREQVAGLKGEQWLEFLNDTGQRIDFKQVRYELLELPYERDNERKRLDLLFRYAKDWIKQRRKPCLN